MFALDSSALLACLSDEPGSDVVQSALEDDAWVHPERLPLRIVDVDPPAAVEIRAPEE